MVGSGAGSFDASPLRPGVVLGGRYRLVAPIGAGGMGEVWRAEHTSLGTPAAVKVLDTSLGGDTAERLQRFHQEARAAAQLRSPHIVHVLDHGVEGRFAFIVMELLVGESLEQRLARAGRLTPAEAARVIAGMARGLSRAHAAGILHRDLKPANVFLAREGDAEVVKLLDFGIAKILGSRADERRAPAQGPAPQGALHQRPHALTHQGNIIGTPSYMSPEQIRGQAVDPRSDLWQMGVIAVECVTGQRPFDALTLGDTFTRICNAPVPAPSSLGPVPPGFDAWALRALSRDPARRFSSATEMAAALLLVLTPGETDVLTTASRTGRVAWSAEPGAQAGAPRRWWIALAAAAAGAVVGIIVFGPRATEPDGAQAGAQATPTAEAALSASPAQPPSEPAAPAAASAADPAPLAPAAPSTAQPSTSAPRDVRSSLPSDRPRPAPRPRPSKTADPLGI